MATRNAKRAGALIFALVGAASLATARPGEAGRGETIAKRWCSACHVVAQDQTRANADAPPFADVALRFADKEIAAFLANPHSKMPDMSLTRDEIADIVAYIRSLDTRPRSPAEPQGVDPGPPKKG